MTQAAVTMYITGWCPYCQRARQLLTEKGADLRLIDVDENAKFRQEMTTRSGRRTVPQVFIGDHHVGGCGDLLALEVSGELDRLLSIHSGQGA